MRKPKPRQQKPQETEYLSLWLSCVLCKYCCLGEGWEMLQGKASLFIDGKFIESVFFPLLEEDIETIAKSWLNVSVINVHNESLTTMEICQLSKFFSSYVYINTFLKHWIGRLANISSPWKWKNQTGSFMREHIKHYRRMNLLFPFPHNIDGAILVSEFSPHFPLISNWKFTASVIC